MTLAKRLLAVAGRGGFTAPPYWRVAGAADLLADLASVWTTNAFTITTGGTVRAEGYQPANIYPALWTRDHAYVLWHYPELLTAAQRRQFVTYYLSRRTTGVEADPDGGTLPADFIADRINATGTATYKNTGISDYPFMDGAAFLVLALWSDWNLTADTATFTSSESALADCLAALPRSVNGCVYSAPGATSVDYGFTDVIQKSGDVAYGTALMAWAYKMMAEMAGEGGTGTYSTLRADAEAGLATLRKVNGFYAGSSGNNATRDDVWATALAVAEKLVSGDDRTASAQAIADAYEAGSITQNGLVRHLPVGQSWAGCTDHVGSYQDGGYWATPVWDCVRAVALVSHSLAHAWAVELVAEIQSEYDVAGANAPYEWRIGATIASPKPYSAHAAIVRRFV